MKRNFLVIITLIFLLALVPILSSSLYRYSFAFQNGEAASVVLGQGNFTAVGGNGGQNGLFGPEGIAIDSKGNLWVSDSENDRVVEFSPPFLIGGSEGLVLGQQNFSSYDCGNPTLHNLCDPQGIAFDSAGDLYVADNSYNRVLEFKPPFTEGETASVAIGTTSNDTTQSSLNSPVGIALDSSNNLWVADEGDERVLEFKAPLSTNESASFVLGQPNYFSNSSGTNQSAFDTPDYLAFDHSGNLWVTDSSNRRVLEFTTPFSINESANLVIGQPNFTSTLNGPLQNVLSSPAGIGFDSSGNLWVTDTYNGRVLEFPTPFSNGENASLVIGVPGFASGVGLPSQTQLSGPEGLVFDSSGNLWVLDSAANRVMEFTQSGTVSSVATASSSVPATSILSSSANSSTPVLTTSSSSTPLSNSSVQTTSSSSLSSSQTSSTSATKSSASSLSISYMVILGVISTISLLVSAPIIRKKFRKS
jgi:sugar lactone lactonase YvrE